MIQTTLVVIKPDGVQRSLIGEIVRRYEQAGLTVCGLKMIRVDRELLKRHYPESMIPALGEKSRKAGEVVTDVNEQGRKVLGWLRAFISSGPVVAMVLRGEDAIAKVRAITGYTDPSAADKGTIRGDLGVDSILKANRESRPVCNLVHASGTPEEAAHEIALWFSREELLK